MILKRGYCIKSLGGVLNLDRVVREAVFADKAFEPLSDGKDPPMQGSGGRTSQVEKTTSAGALT